jgi:hypothetical protein
LRLPDPRLLLPSRGTRTPDVEQEIEEAQLEEEYADFLPDDAFASYDDEEATVLEHPVAVAPPARAPAARAKAAAKPVARSTAAEQTELIPEDAGDPTAAICRRRPAHGGAVRDDLRNRQELDKLGKV